MMQTTQGCFITFEGIDGAGKSSHIDYIAQRLEQMGRTVVQTREPGGTPLGEALRELLLHHEMHLETEALLMFAARREHIEKVIQPALRLGKCVLSDRFTDASWAYQGGGRGLSSEKLSILEHWVHGDLQPDLTILFDIDPKIAAARLMTARVADRFESEQLSFFSRVRNTYLERAKAEPNRFCVIDSSRSILEIRRDIDTILASHTALLMN